MRRLVAWWWHPRQIMATMVVAFWGHMAAWPQSYTSGTYAVVTDAAPLRWWAIAFTVSGAVMLATRPSVLAPVVAVGALLCAWLAGLLAASFTGDSQSPAGAVFVAGYVALLFWGAGRNINPEA